MNIRDKEIYEFEQWQALEDLFDYATANDVRIKQAKYGERNMPGTHLVEPSLTELSQAIEEAAIDFHHVIWCHKKSHFLLKLVKKGGV